MSASLESRFSIEQFETGDIDASQFDHEAHVYVGWLYLQTLPRKEATAKFDAALRRLVASIGAESKYNAMITWLFLLLIDERAQDNEDWPAFRARNSDLFDDRPRLNAA